MASMNKGKSGAPLDDIDYKSAYTEGMDAVSSVAPTEYSGLPDYQSAYNTDDNASVFTGVTGAEGAYCDGSRISKRRKSIDVDAASDVSRRSRKKRKMEEDYATDYRSSYMDGAETVSPSEYVGEETKDPDYKSAFDETATMYTDVTGTSAMTRTTRRSRMRSQQSQNKVNEPEISVSQASPATFSQIPIICHTDVDASEGIGFMDNNIGNIGNIGDIGNIGEGEDPGKAESVYSTVYLGDIKAPDPKPSPTDASMYGPMYSGEMNYEGGCSETVYNAFQDDFVRKSWFQNLNLSQPFVALLHSDDWIVYAFIFLTCMLVACFGSIGYLASQSPVGESSEEFLNEVSRLRSELQEIQQDYVHALQEASQIYNETQEIAQALGALQNDTDNLRSENQHIDQLVSRIQSIGKTPSTAIRSCASLPPYYESGYYFISSRNGPPVRLYCDKEFRCNGIPGGWTRMAKLEANNNSNQCPPGLVSRTHDAVHYCISQSPSEGCASVNFGSFGIRYSEVCGRIIGLQLGIPKAFDDHPHNINLPYVDGISLTYGIPRNHIWTFAAASDEASTNFRRKCPCIYAGNPHTEGPPDFVRSDYFCDTGSSREALTVIVHKDDPLWDGDGCGNRNTCCMFNNPPWFYRQLPRPTADDVDMRVCRRTLRKTGDILISIVDIYVR